MSFRDPLVVSRASGCVRSRVRYGGRGPAETRAHGRRGPPAPDDESDARRDASPASTTAPDGAEDGVASGSDCARAVRELPFPTLSTSDARFDEKLGVAFRWGPPGPRPGRAQRSLRLRRLPAPRPRAIAPRPRALARDLLGRRRHEKIPEHVRVRRPGDRITPAPHPTASSTPRYGTSS